MLKLILSSLLLFPFQVLAQGHFTKLFTDTNHCHFTHVSQADGSNFIMVGYSDISVQYGFELILCKTDSAGNILWQKEYSDSLMEIGYHVERTADGGYIVGAVSSSFVPNNPDLVIMKTDSTGIQQWVKTFQAISSGTDWNTKVAELDSGGYIMSAYSNTWSGLFICRLDMAGDVLWARNFGINGSTLRCSDFCKTGDGGYVVIGEFSHHLSDLDNCLMKVDGSGNLEWYKCIGDSTGNEEPFSVVQVRCGDYLIAGTTNVYPGSAIHTYVLCLDSTGTTKWNKIYNTLYGNLEGSKMIKSEDGGVYVTFNRYQETDVLKLDSAGNVIWGSKFPKLQSDVSTFAACLAPQGLLIVGEEVLTNGNKAAFIRSVDFSGAGCNYIPLQVIDSLIAPPEYILGSALSPVITAISVSLNEHNLYLMASEPCGPVGVTEPAMPQSSVYISMNEVLHVDLESNEKCFVILYDIHGRRVFEKIISSEGVDVSNLKSGLYIAEVNGIGSSIWKKITKQ
jgi:hypothetical protein